MADRPRRAILERLENRILLAGDLVAHWRAADLLSELGDGQPIQQWTDSISSTSAISFGTPSLATNVFGGRPAVRFDDVDGKDGFRVPKAQSPLAGADDFSVAVLFAVSSVQTGEATNWFDGTGLVHANQNGFNRDWGIALHGDQVGVGIGRGLFQPSTSVFSAPTTLGDGEPQLAVFTRQSGHLSIYVDRAAAVTVDGASSDARDALDMIFGVPNTTDGMFLGDIAEVRIYNGALTSDEVLAVGREIDAYYQNSLPVANDDQYAVDEDGTLFISGDQGVLANDTDAENDSLTVSVVELPQHGQLGLNPDGSFIYAPDDDFFGNDTFTYVANDFRDSEPATVRIEVRPKNDLAIGVVDSYKALPSVVLNVEAAAGVLSNDINVDGEPISAMIANDVTFGLLVLNSDGSFSYDAQGNAGQNFFSYRINDGGELSDPIQVLIVVNTPPVAVDDEFAVDEDSELVLAADQGLTGNDLDADDDELRVSVIESPTNGELTWDTTGAFVYKPALNFEGSDRFSYTVSDRSDTSNVATVSLTVRAVNDLPVVSGETYFVSAGSPLDVPVERGLLANDFDIEDETLTSVIERSPRHGQVDLQSNGSFRYIPDADYVGIDEFTYVVRDSNDAEVSADVRLFVGTSPVRINEIMAANRSTLVTSIRQMAEERFESDVLTPDWIELANTSDQSVDVSGLYLTDNSERPAKWRIPDGVEIPANDFLVILATRLDIADPRLDELGLLHTNFKLSSDQGEYVALLSPGGQVLDSVESLPEARPDFSIGTEGEATGYLTMPTPGEPNSEFLDGVVADVVFSDQRGFYDAPVVVELSVATPDAEIYYTLNGASPTQESGIAYTDPLTVSTTTNIRAAAYKANHVPSAVSTHSYFFLADVLQQPADPEGFPDRWGSAGRADYEMDPRIASDPESEIYDSNVETGLTSLPTISLTMDVDEFFGTRGIQSNPQSKGDQWERATSVEFIGFDGFDDAQFDSGIRMVGNASRNPNRSKHNMRLAFRDDYGDSNLNVPLFGLGDWEQHENLILRGGNGDSWVNPGVIQRAQYIRDQWQRDLQFAMGHLSTHQLYSHLYINGLYWGLYHVFERHDASFLALHMGGDQEDYEAIKDVNGNTGNVEPVSGETAAWEEIFEIVDDRNLSDGQKYEEVQRRVDVDNMIDYILINFYAGNNDWDHNNFRTGRHIDGKFIFFTWDSERQDINALGTPAAGGPVTINVTSFNKAGRPTRIHSRLDDVDDYVIRFADRVQKHFFNDGALTPDRAGGLWNARADEIRLSLSAESARWGDRHSRTPRTVADWESTLALMNEEFFPVRTDIVLQQLQRRGLYPDVSAPDFSQHGGQIEDGFELSMVAAEGIIFYTTDGTDPRQPGGAVSPDALVYDESIPIGSDSRIKARVLLNDEWSALTEAEFETSANPADRDSLRISEIHFNPASPSEVEIAAGFDDNDEFEFIELLNISSNTIDLQNVRLTTVDGQGVNFDFSDGEIKRLGPQERLLVVEDLDAFAQRYGDDLPVAGQWSGRLSNGGETIYLASGDEIFLELAYDDSWYVNADGGGSSLELLDPAAVDIAVWATAAGWRSSVEAGGTPGSEASVSEPGDSNRDGVFDSRDLVAVFQAGEYEDLFATNSTFEEGDWNGDGEFDSSDLVFVFQLGNYIAAALQLFELEAFS